MRYSGYRDAVAEALRRSPRGLTWAQLRRRLDLPYDRPCPAWMQQLEREIGLTRVNGGNGSRALVWKLASRLRKTAEAK